MTTYDLDEVEQAFRAYWQAGAVNEDWDAWVELFTEDVTYVEHILGDKHGREEVRAWIKPIMAEFGELYTVYEWHLCDPSGRVVVYMQNRRDHPDPSQPPIDFPGMTVLEYAGAGKFSLEEDFWSLPEGQRTMKAYVDACAEHDPEHPKKRTRRDWGNGPDWAKGAPTYDQRAGAGSSSG
ncbi:MAG TPA: nuclear transport factor 2 family protein [Acidimicrobiia bacterium]|nr:nuclear transport factor 2 family protein [Acidimicrobiia bacterium]